MPEGKKELPKQLAGMGRRRHIRLSLMGLARLTVRGEEPQDVYMGCIGRGGAGLYMHGDIKAKQLVVLDLKLMEERWMELEMKLAARVRWVQRLGQLNMVGLQFEKISDERYSILLRHLRLMKELQL